VRDSSGVIIIDHAGNDHGWQNVRQGRLSVDPIVQIGVRDVDNPIELFHRILDVRMLSGGRIAVADGGSAQVRIFDGGGRHFATIGRSGRGPGEFRWPARIFEFGPDSIAAFDVENVRVAVFGQDFKLARTFRPEAPPPPLRFALVPLDQFDDGTLLFGAPGQPELTAGVHREAIALLHYDRDGQVIKSFGQFEDQAIDGDAGAPLTYGPRAWAVADGTGVWLGSGDRLELNRYGATLNRVIRTDHQPRQMHQSAVDAFQRQLRRQYPGNPSIEAISRRLRFPEVFPVHSQLLWDPGGYIWVRLYDDDQVYDESIRRPVSTWLILGVEEPFMGTVRTDAGFTPKHIRDDRIAGVWLKRGRRGICQSLSHRKWG
jgi:hypothetical protein